GHALGSFAVSVEARFALVEIATLGGIAGRWELATPQVTAARYKACLRDVAELAATGFPDRERWRAGIGFRLESPCTSGAGIGNVACALMWCGCMSPTRAVTDEQLAQQFGADRASFVRDRGEALRWLVMLLEFSQRSPEGRP